MTRRAGLRARERELRSGFDAFPPSQGAVETASAVAVAEWSNLLAYRCGGSVGFRPTSRLSAPAWAAPRRG